MWPILACGDLEIVIASFDRHPLENALVIRGETKLTDEQKDCLRLAGFREMKGPSTVWARDTKALKMREIRAAFPGMRAVNFERGAPGMRVRGVNPFSANPPLPVDGDEEQELPPPTRAPALPVNDYQVKYLPASRIGQPIATIPVHLAEPTRRALENIENVYGPVDEFVAERLQVTVHELAKMLSPEQVDAVAMGISATERDRELIIADQTGLGKGRILAALAMAAVLEGKNVVFMTEKANLFSDFWRDVVDIGADKVIGQPFLLNSGANVRDVSSLNGDVLFEALPEPQLRKVIRSGELPEGYRMMMCTYSQFNRKDSAKGKLLRAVSGGAYCIKDEAHNAAGKDSNTGGNVAFAFEDAAGVVRSSATFATSAEDLLAYAKSLPPSLRTEEARAMLASAGTEIAEVLAQFLAEDGTLIRREQDLSGIDLKLEIDDKNVERNRSYQDKLAPILRRMARLQRQVEDLIEVKNEEAEEGGGKAGKEKWYTSNFGSRLAMIRRQFLTALSVEHCVERCVQALLANEKPTVVIESTMESLMRELEGKKSIDGIEDPEDMPEDAIQFEGARPPDFPAALSVMLDRIMEMSVKRGKDADAEKVPVEDQYCRREAQAIRDMLDDFPALSLSPIDDIKDRVEQIGRALHAEGTIDHPWRVGEISARNMRVRDGKYEPMPKVDRNDTIVRFQNGHYDMAILTGAASTGLSLHASERAADQRVRRMIELQIPRNVRQRAQFWGRIDRRGQVVLPKFEVLSSGLLTQTRIIIMENNKVRSMYANVSGSAETGKAMDGVPDLINSIGNKVAQHILEDRPKLAESMQIGMRGIDQETAEQELYYVNKLLGRLDLLSCADSDKLFDMLISEFEAELAAQLASGRSARGTRELDGQWTEVSRRIYEDGRPEDGEVFGRAVEIVVMEGTFERDAVTTARVRAALKQSRERLSAASGNAAGPFFEKQVAAIRRRRRDVLNASLAGRYNSVEIALKDKEPNAVKNAEQRLNSLMKFAESLQPGLPISVPNEDGESMWGLIVDVRPPEEAMLPNPGSWAVKIAVPGREGFREVSIATLIREKAYNVAFSRAATAEAPNLDSFDKAASSVVTEQREFLTGNLVQAVAIAKETKAGSMVTFQRADGGKERSVLITRGHRRSDLFSRAAKTTDPFDARLVLDDGRAMFTDVGNRLAGIIVEAADRGYLFSIPMRGKKYPKERYADLCQTFRQDRQMLAAKVKPENIEELLQRVFDDGAALHYEGVPRPVQEVKKPSWMGGSKSGPSQGFASRR
jgi:hypothetical protein